MVDLPEHLAKVLEELEARKQSLRSRLDSLDNAINGLQGLRSSPDFPLDLKPDVQVTSFELVDDASDAVAGGEQLQREDPESVHSSQVTRTQADPSQVRRNQSAPSAALLAAQSKGLAERSKNLKRPASQQLPGTDRRTPNELNIYVNRNAEWASKQFVAAKSPRAIFRHKTGQRCPKCGSQDTRLSLTRGLADCLMFLFDYSLARCRNCDTRFRIWRSREEDEGEQDFEAQPHSEL